MKIKRLLQTVNLKDKNKKVRPILVESDHPLLEVYEDIKEFFTGNLILAKPEIAKGENWNEVEKVEYYSPVEGSGEKINPTEYEQKVQPLIKKTIESFESKSFDESDPDQFEKKALLNSFKLPSDDLSEYVVKIGSYFVLCNWGLENAPKLGELPPPPPRIRKDTPKTEDENEIVPSEEEGIDSEEIGATTSDDIENNVNVEEENELDREGTIEIPKDGDEPEADAISWFKEYWWKILLGIIIFIILLFLIRTCNDGLNRSNSTLSDNSQSGTTQTEQVQPNGSESSSTQSDSEQPGGREPGSSGGIDNQNLPDGEDSPAVRPSPPSSESPPIINERPDDLLENEESYREGIPTDLWNEIGKIFEMETDEGYWYWLRLENGDTFLMEFIPKEGQTNSSDSESNYYNTI